MPIRPATNKPKQAYKPKDNRPNSAARGYDRKWRKFRKWFLSHNPLCANCLDAGRAEPATEVHHIVPVRERPDLKLNAGNCRALCKSCHSRETVAEREK